MACLGLTGGVWLKASLISSSASFLCPRAHFPKIIRTTSATAPTPTKKRKSCEPKEPWLLSSGSSSDSAFLGLATLAGVAVGAFGGVGIGGLAPEIDAIEAQSAMPSVQ